MISSKRDFLIGLEGLIADAVLRGAIAEARYQASVLAAVRDGWPTAEEFLSSLECDRVLGTITIVGGGHAAATDSATIDEEPSDA